jgi:hypothetical protein
VGDGEGVALHILVCDPVKLRASQQGTPTWL